MSNLAKGKRWRNIPNPKLSIQTKASNLGHYQDNLNLKLLGNKTTKGVFSNSVHQPLLELRASLQSPVPISIINTARAPMNI